LTIELASRRFHFDLPSKEGALVLFPDGASRFDYRSCGNMLRYAQRHVRTWYEHVNGRLGMEVHNGALYLVTGADKTANWCLAAFPRTSGGWLKFTSTNAQPFSYTSSCTVEARTCSTSGHHKNQCAFIRGYKLALPESLYEALLVGVKASDIVTSNPSDIHTKGKSIPGKNTPTWFSWSSRNDYGASGESTTNRAHHMRTKSLMVTLLPST
jgi:hypothetical protein